jgi:hypothetical protein
LDDAGWMHASMGNKATPANVDTFAVLKLPQEDESDGCVSIVYCTNSKVQEGACICV